MKKIDIFQVFKIHTTRLEKSGYNLQLSYEQGIINEEIIGIGSSQLLRVLRRELGYQKGDLFIKEYVSIVVDKKSQYRYINKHGVFINGKKFVRFCCSAANARTNTVFLIQDDCYDRMFEIMCCGINPDGKEMNLAKWNAYFALNASSSYEIPEPRVVVIPDRTTNLKHGFDFLDGYKDIITKDMEVEDFTTWDGMGLMSEKFAASIMYAMDLDYLPSCCIIRNSFIKGAVACMSFDDFNFVMCDGEGKIKDIYGDVVSLSDVDMILTASQFKMWKEYKSFQEYVEASHKYGLGWSVTRVARKEDDTVAFTNYQFLQVLSLSQEQVSMLCKPTIDWFNSVIGGDVATIILYLYGQEKQLKLEDVEDCALKALIYNNKLIEDNYIKNRIIRSLNKKIRQAYTGKLIVEGNFSFMLCDPVGLLEWAVGMDPIGALSKGKCYCEFWNKRGVKKVAACRSPLTWVSENNILELENDESLQEWYKYLSNGCVIYNQYGVDTFLHADSDFDGDLVFTTNQKEFIEGKNKDYQLPVTYTKTPAPKQIFSAKKLCEVDMLSFGSQIGFITNCSTYWYSLIKEYCEDSVEHEELVRRLKWTRGAQGNQIDKTKGLIIEEFPRRWYDFKYAECDLDKRLIVKKKPYFQRYIYPSLDYKYKEHINNVNLYSKVHFGVPMSECTDKDFIYVEYEQNPVLDNDSVMNRICHYMEKNVKFLKEERKKQNQEIIDDVLMDYSQPLQEKYIWLAEECLKRYKQMKNDMRDDIRTMSRDEKEERKLKFKISCSYIRDYLYAFLTDRVDVANLVVWVGYQHKSNESKEFVWDVFGEDVILNVMKNSQEHITIPIEDGQGIIKYLGKTYSLKEIKKEGQID